MKSLGVRVTCSEISECLQKIAHQRGYEWINHGKIIKNQDSPWLSFNFAIPYEFGHDFTTIGNQYDIQLDGIKNFDEIVQYIKDNARPKTVEVKCGDYVGKISEDGQKLVIDCQELTFNEVDHIHKVMLKAQKGDS